MGLFDSVLKVVSKVLPSASKTAAVAAPAVLKTVPSTADLLGATAVKSVLSSIGSSALGIAKSIVSSPTGQTVQKAIATNVLPIVGIQIGSSIAGIKTPVVGKETAGTIAAGVIGGRSAAIATGALILAPAILSTATTAAKAVQVQANTTAQTVSKGYASITTTVQQKEQAIKQAISTPVQTAPVAQYLGRVAQTQVLNTSDDVKPGMGTYTTMEIETELDKLREKVGSTISDIIPSVPTAATVGLTGLGIAAAYVATRKKTTKKKTTTKKKVVKRVKKVPKKKVMKRVKKSKTGSARQYARKGGKAVKYTSKGQPYIIQNDGKALFIKK